jgi:DNA-binding transcriptional ArsR family regulator
MTAEPDDDLWAAIADPSRRRILDLLVHHGEASASRLASRVPFSRQAVSKHLVVLEQAGLIGRRKHGKEVLFHLDAARFDQATRAIADLARQWDRRLDAIKRLAEAVHSQPGKAQDPIERSPQK